MKNNKNNNADRSDDDLPPPNSKPLSGESSSENDDTELWRKIVATAEIRADARLAQQQEVQTLQQERAITEEKIKNVDRLNKRIPQLELNAIQPKIEAESPAAITQENHSRWMVLVIFVCLALIAFMIGSIAREMSDAKDLETKDSNWQGRGHP